MVLGSTHPQELGYRDRPTAPVDFSKTCLRLYQRNLEWIYAIQVVAKMTEFTIMKLDPGVKASGECATCGQDTQDAEHLWMSYRKVDEFGRSPIVGSDIIRVDANGPVCASCANSDHYRPHISTRIGD